MQTVKEKKQRIARTSFLLIQKDFNNTNFSQEESLNLLRKYVKISLHSIYNFMPPQACTESFDAMLLALTNPDMEEKKVKWFVRTYLKSESVFAKRDYAALERSKIRYNYAKKVVGEIYGNSQTFFNTVFKDLKITLPGLPNPKIEGMQVKNNSIIFPHESFDIDDTVDANICTDSEKMNIRR